MKYSKMYLVTEEEYLKIQKKPLPKSPKKYKNIKVPLDQKVLMNSMRAVSAKTKWQKYK